MRKARAAFTGCILKQLPEELKITAARTAASENPVNLPAGAPEIKRIGALTSKYWGARPMEFATAFMEPVSAALSEKILAHLNAWNTVAGCNKTFRLTTQIGSAQCRITLAFDGYWSYLGTDVLHVPLSEPTMCFQGFTARTVESEFYRVVRHEAGHHLGFPHEHMRRDVVALIDPQKAIAYFWQTQRWTAEEVRAQVLTPIEDRSMIDPTRADGTSIMCYQLPAQICINGQPIPGGTDLDELDKAYAAKIYPLAAVPPKPTLPAADIATVVLLDAEGKEIARLRR